MQRIVKMTDKIEHICGEPHKSTLQRMILQERLDRRWTQQEMADFLGVSQATVCRLESDDYTGLKLQTIITIADKLGYDYRVEFEKKIKKN